MGELDTACQQAIAQTEIEALDVDMWIATFGKQIFDDLLAQGLIEKYQLEGTTYVMLTETGMEYAAKWGH